MTPLVADPPRGVVERTRSGGMQQTRCLDHVPLVVSLRDAGSQEHPPARRTRCRFSPGDGARSLAGARGSRPPSPPSSVRSPGSARPRRRSSAVGSSFQIRSASPPYLSSTRRAAATIHEGRLFTQAVQGNPTGTAHGLRVGDDPRRVQVAEALLQHVRSSPRALVPDAWSKITPTRNANPSVRMSSPDSGSGPTSTLGFLDHVTAIRPRAASLE